MYLSNIVWPYFPYKYDNESQFFGGQFLAIDFRYQVFSNMKDYYEFDIYYRYTLSYMSMALVEVRSSQEPISHSTYDCIAEISQYRSLGNKQTTRLAIGSWKWVTIQKRFLFAVVSRNVVKDLVCVDLVLCKHTLYMFIYIALFGRTLS